MGKAYRPALMTSAALFGGLLSVMLCGPVARADEPELSISGYDPVAYFTDGRPVQGERGHAF
jgi:hypothetical protein